MLTFFAWAHVLKVRAVRAWKQQTANIDQVNEIPQLPGDGTWLALPGAGFSSYLNNCSRRWDPASGPKEERLWGGADDTKVSYLCLSLRD
jgi:hypothetical protein